MMEKTNCGYHDSPSCPRVEIDNLEPETLRQILFLNVRCKPHNNSTQKLLNHSDYRGFLDYFNSELSVEMLTHKIFRIFTFDCSL